LGALSLLLEPELIPVVVPDFILLVFILPTSSWNGWWRPVRRCLRSTRREPAASVPKRLPSPPVLRRPRGLR
jgi:hypothetical protein